MGFIPSQKNFYCYFTVCIFNKYVHCFMYEVALKHIYYIQRWFIDIFLLTVYPGDKRLIKQILKGFGLLGIREQFVCYLKVSEGD